jgi:hypothetical protein
MRTPRWLVALLLLLLPARLVLVELVTSAQLSAYRPCFVLRKSFCDHGLACKLVSLLMAEPLTTRLTPLELLHLRHQTRELCNCVRVQGGVHPPGGV